MFDIHKVTPEELINNTIKCDNTGQNPRPVCEHIFMQFFGYDPNDTDKQFFEKLEKGQHPFQQKTGR